MCGRFTLRVPTSVLVEEFMLESMDPWQPRFNICPTQSVPVIRRASAGSARTCVLMRWGLIPSWAKDAKIGNSLINARSETVSQKPSFGSAFRRRRCLIPADGFYEWQRRPGHKQPYFIRRPDDGPFAFAGLFESWNGPPDAKDGPAWPTFTVITTEANALMRPIHDRMPVILNAHDFDLWLDPDVQDAALLQPLLRPCPDEVLAADPVSTFVNSPTHDSPECVRLVDSNGADS